MIDFHTHIAYHKLYPDKFLQGVFSGNKDPNNSLHKVVSVVKLFLKDKECSQLLKQMDEAEIEKAVLLIIDDNAFLGNTELTIEENYQLHFNILKKYPEKFIVFAGYHPGRVLDLRLLKKGIEEFGFKGVKLYPPYGFKINDPQLNACYEYCEQLSLPVLIHTGFSLYGLDNENAEPNVLKEIASNYQNITFIMAHAGYKLGDPVIQTLLLKKNIYADISGFQTIINSEKGIEALKMIFKEPYNNKILFGSDWPITNLMKPLVNQVNIIREMEKDVADKAENALNNILKNNAQKILKLI